MTHLIIQPTDDAQIAQEQLYDSLKQCLVQVKDVDALTHEIPHSTLVAHLEPGEDSTKVPQQFNGHPVITDGSTLANENFRDISLSLLSTFDALLELHVQVTSGNRTPPPPEVIEDFQNYSHRIREVLAQRGA